MEKIPVGGASQHQVHELHHAFPEDCEDRDIVLKAVTTAGANLQYASAAVTSGNGVASTW